MTFPEYTNIAAAFVAPPMTYTNLRGEGVHMQWDVVRRRGREPDAGVVTLWNIPSSEQASIRSAWLAAESTLGAHYRVTLSFGWQGVVMPMFVSEVMNIIPDRDGADEILTFELGDGVRTIRDAQVLGTSFAKTTTEVIIQFIVTTQLKTTIDPASLSKITESAAQLPVTLWNNYVVMGDPADRLDELIDMLGLEWKIHNGVFIVMEKGNRATAAPDAFVLSPLSGLIKAHPLEGEGVQAQSLGDPRMAPGSQFTVQNPVGVPIGSPVQRCESVQFSGQTDEDCIMTVVGRKAILV